MTVYLHIGLPKTGTTAVQNWLSQHSMALAEKGAFTYAEPILGHRLAVSAITDRKRLNLPDIPPIMAASMEDALGKILGDTRPAIISSEYFSLAQPELAKALFPTDQVEVILTLRRQDRLIESGYCQNVMHMGWSVPLGAPCYSEAHDWNLLTSKWASVFGEDHLHVRLYNEKRDGNLIVELFSGLPILQTLREFPPPLSKVNASLPADLIEFKRIANSIGAGEAAQSLISTALKAGRNGPPFRLDPENAKAILDIYRESNRAVARRFFGDKITIPALDA